MWHHRPSVSSMDSQPVKYVEYNSLAEIKVGPGVQGQEVEGPPGQGVAEVQRSVTAGLLPWPG